MTEVCRVLPSHSRSTALLRAGGSEELALAAEDGSADIVIDVVEGGGAAAQFGGEMAVVAIEVELDCAELEEVVRVTAPGDGRRLERNGIGAGKVQGECSEVGGIFCRRESSGFGAIRGAEAEGNQEQGGASEER